MTAASPELLRKASGLGALPLAQYALATSAFQREALQEAQREATYFERAHWLGASRDDARTILDCERGDANCRTRTTGQAPDRDAMWREINEQLLRHVMGEPYDPELPPGQRRLEEWLVAVGVIPQAP